MITDTLKFPRLKIRQSLPYSFSIGRSGEEVQRLLHCRVFFSRQQHHRSFTIASDCDRVPIAGGSVHKTGKAVSGFGEGDRFHGRKKPPAQNTVNLPSLLFGSVREFVRQLEALAFSHLAPAGREDAFE